MTSYSRYDDLKIFLPHVPSTWRKQTRSVALCKEKIGINIIVQVETFLVNNCGLDNFRKHLTMFDNKQLRSNE